MPILQKYKEWIDQVDAVYGKCSEVTLEMAREFPELTRVRGHYICPIWGKRAHWWLTLDNEIIDPTKRQFPSGGLGEYIIWDENSPEPTGRCLDCGNYVYDHKTFCSKNCEISTRNYMGI